MLLWSRTWISRPSKLFQVSSVHIRTDFPIPCVLSVCYTPIWFIDFSRIFTRPSSLYPVDQNQSYLCFHFFQNLTLAVDQVRNGFAELMKISAVGDSRTWSLLVNYGVELIETKFGRLDIGSENSHQIKAIADEVCDRGIKLMLDVSLPLSLVSKSLSRLIWLSWSTKSPLDIGSLRHPTYTKSASIGSLRLVIHGHQLWNFGLNYLWDTDTQSLLTWRILQRWLGAEVI